MILMWAQFLLCLILSCQATQRRLNEDTFSPCNYIPSKPFGLLVCSYQGFNEIPIFPNTEKVKLLDLNENRLEIIPRGAFANLGQNLAIISIRNNKANYINITASAFINLPKLTSIEISQTTSSSNNLGIEVDLGRLTASIPTLTTLRLKRLNIHKISPLALPALAELSLEAVPLFGGILDGGFKDASRLQNLTLHEVSNVQVFLNMAEWLSPLTQLKKLDLSHNNLGTLGSLIFPSATSFSLNSLFLSYCQFQGANQPYITLNAPAAKSLQKLDLSYNKYVEYEAFSDLKNLRILIMRGFQSTGMPRFIKALVQLEELDIESSLLSQINEGDFGVNSQIQKLVVKSKHVSFYIDSAVFDSLSDLNILSLHFSNVENVGFDYGDSWKTIFTKVQQISTLSMINMQITDTFLNSITVLTNLKKLYLSNNKIKILPNNFFTTLPHLTVLDLQNNLIRSVPFQTLSVSKITQLNLSNNSLSTVDGCLLGENPEKYGLVLSKNPLLCDCHITWMLKYYKIGAGVVCSATGPHASKLLNTLSDDQLTCSDSKLAICAPITTPSTQTMPPPTLSFTIKEFGENSVIIKIDQLQAGFYPKFKFRYKVQNSPDNSYTETSFYPTATTNSIQIKIPSGVGYSFCLMVYNTESIFETSKCQLYILTVISKSSMSATQIGLIIAGAILVVISVIGIAIYLAKRSERRRKKKEAVYAYQATPGYDEYQGGMIYPDQMSQAGCRSTLDSNGRMTYQMGSRHSLAQSALSLTQLGNSQPRAYQGDPGYGPTDPVSFATTGRVNKYRSRSMDMLDAPKLRPTPRAFRRANGSTGDLLRASQASLASQRMPLRSGGRQFQTAGAEIEKAPRIMNIS